MRSAGAGLRGQVNAQCGGGACAVEAALRGSGLALLGLPPPPGACQWDPQSSSLPTAMRSLAGRGSGWWEATAQLQFDQVVKKRIHSIPASPLGVRAGGATPRGAERSWALPPAWRSSGGGRYRGRELAASLGMALVAFFILQQRPENPSVSA